MDTHVLRKAREELVREREVVVKRLDDGITAIDQLLGTSAPPIDDEPVGVAAGDVAPRPRRKVTVRKPGRRAVREPRGSRAVALVLQEAEGERLDLDGLTDRLMERGLGPSGSERPKEAVRANARRLLRTDPSFRHEGRDYWFAGSAPDEPTLAAAGRDGRPPDEE